MLEGAFVENVMMHSETRVYPVVPQDTAGIVLGSQSIYKYSLRESTYPTLSIVDEICDANGNIIPSGHYELALSDEMDFLLLLQSKNLIATLPVFKVEFENVAEKNQIKDKKALKQEKKEKLEIEKTNKKREKVGMPPINNDKDIYQEAILEYIPKGNYYLIKYERGPIKAWAAIKS